MKEQDVNPKPSGRPYQKPVVRKIKLDRDISIQMQSPGTPPGDPYTKDSRDSGGFSPLK